MSQGRFAIQGRLHHFQGSEPGPGPMSQGRVTLHGDPIPRPPPSEPWQPFMPGWNPTPEIDLVRRAPQSTARVAGAPVAPVGTRSGPRLTRAEPCSTRPVPRLTPEPRHTHEGQSRQPPADRPPNLHGRPWLRPSQVTVSIPSLVWTSCALFNDALPEALTPWPPMARRPFFHPSGPRVPGQSHAPSGPHPQAPAVRATAAPFRSWVWNPTPRVRLSSPRSPVHGSRRRSPGSSRLEPGLDPASHEQSPVQRGPSPQGFPHGSVPPTTAACVGGSLRFDFLSLPSQRLRATALPSLLGPAGCEQRLPSTKADRALTRGGLRFPID